MIEKNSLRLTPVSLSQANEFVKAHHRHHKAVAGHKFSIGCSFGNQLVGVAIVGRPVSRYLDDGSYVLLAQKTLAASCMRLRQELQKLWGTQKS